MLFWQTSSNVPADLVQRTASRLLAYQGKKPDEQQAIEVHDIDLNLIGWPWAEGNFSWVEPTAWACLALRHAGYGRHPRVQQGLRLLLDRTFDEGGINYGNRTILGLPTEPIPGPTALMLLAFQGQASDARVAASTRYLLRQARQSDDLEHLGWAKLALDCYADLPDIAEGIKELDERLQAGYDARGGRGWLRPAPARVALTALGLAAGDSNPMRLSRSVLAKEMEEGQPPVLAVVAGKTRKSWGERIKSTFRGMAVNALGNLRQPPAQSAVHIAKAGDYNGNLADILQRQYENFRASVPLKGKRVVLKPNIVEYHRDKVINTNPLVIAAAIELCQREGAAEVIVAEGPGHWRNVEYLVNASGLGDVLRHYQVTFKDLNHDEPTKSPNLGRLTGMEYLYLARTVATAEVLISMPKLKVHHWAGATLSMKNLFGTLPGICYGWPKNELHWRGIDNSIVDINLTRTPDLEIVDGIVGMEGDGPINGTPKHMGTLIMGTDPLAVDATCCRLMELNPEKICYLVMASQKKLGRMNPAEIQQLGETIESLAQPFATVPHFESLRMAKSA